MEEKQKKIFFIFGTLLFLIGLLNGFVLSSFTNPRAALSAHLAGIQGGMALMIFGLMWNHVKGAPWGLKFAHALSIYSMYSIWLGLLLSAIWGTRGLITGAGFQSNKDHEVMVLLLTMSGGIAILVSAIIILFGLCAGKRKNEVENQ